MTILRRQILLHSYLYHGLKERVWEKHAWEQRSTELHQLQKENGWNINFYDELFKNWEGKGGDWLPTNKGLDTEIVRVAQRIVANERLAAERASVKTPLGSLVENST